MAGIVAQHRKQMKFCNSYLTHNIFNLYMRRFFFGLVYVKRNWTWSLATVTSPNIARPLTLRTSPSDYATFNKIKTFLLFNIGLPLEREKQQKVSSLNFHC